MPPEFYDPTSPDEMPVPLPCAPHENLPIFGATLQPPLTRRGHGPGLIVFLPPVEVLGPPTKRSLDPQPQMKWAEEGFAVVTVSCTSKDVHIAIDSASRILIDHKAVDTKDKIAIIAYDPAVLDAIMNTQVTNTQLACIVAYGQTALANVPTLIHATSTLDISVAAKTHGDVTVHSYTTSSPYFVIPGYGTYQPGLAAIAHTRTLVFLRKHLGGPNFDLEKIWDEHTYFEFEVRSVAKTMATMVQEPYVNHIPTMTGGIGRENLTAFYRDHFIFNNPTDLMLDVVSRTVGPDRIIDEFILRLTHDCVVDWLLPGVPPTGKKLAIPMISVVNIRGDRLYHEHIWWDQGTALVQAGILPTHVDHPQGRLRLPVAGEESARLLIDETDGTSNQMFGPGWGASPA